MTVTRQSPYSVPVSSRYPVRRNLPSSRPSSPFIYTQRGFPPLVGPSHHWIPGVTTPQMTMQRVVPVRPAASHTLSAGSHRHAMAGSPGCVVAARVIITGVFASALITIPTACYAVAMHLPSTGR
jgi:hypothetical protein